VLIVHDLGNEARVADCLVGRVGTSLARAHKLTGMILAALMPAMPRNRSTRWTEGEEKQLLELDAAGDPPRVIALKLQRSVRAVSLRLSQLKKNRLPGSGLRNSWE